MRYVLINVTGLHECSKIESSVRTIHYESIDVHKARKLVNFAYLKVLSYVFVIMFSCL